MHLSVIIPTRNRASLVAALLESLALLDPVPWDWEVIVVDNGSTDDTAEQVKQKQAVLPMRIRYVMEARLGLHEGRNRGAAEAVGKYLAYLDDDMILASSWLQGVAMLQTGIADAVVGRILPRWESAPPDWLTHMFKSGVFGPLALLDLGEGAAQTDHFFGCNLFIPRETVFDFGGFHPDGMPQHLLHLRGDGETGLWLKMRAAGKSLWYAPSAIAFHIVPDSRMTAEYMFKRAYNQGISQSFTDLRTRQGLYGKRPSGFRCCARNVKSRLSQLPVVRNVKYCITHLRAKSEVDREIAYIQYEMSKGVSQGMLFHRKALRNKADLIKYALQTSYVGR